MQQEIECEGLSPKVPGGESTKDRGRGGSKTRGGWGLRVTRQGRRQLQTECTPHTRTGTHMLARLHTHTKRSKTRF